MNLCYAGIGSRETPEEILALMGEIASRLDKLGYTLRSGGADGADTAFELAVSLQPPEIYVPWLGFIKGGNPTQTTARNARAHVVTQQAAYARALAIAEKFHPNWQACGTGARKMHARNVMQVLGAGLDNPSQFIVCWTKNGKPSGGTGQALRIAEGTGVRILNLQRSEDQMMAWQLSGGSDA